MYFVRCQLGDSPRASVILILLKRKNSTFTAHIGSTLYLKRKMSISEKGYENPITDILERHPEFAVDASYNYEVKEGPSTENQQNFSAEPIFSASVDEGVQANEMSLSRSSSMISLVIVEKKDLDGMYDSDDSEYGKNALSNIMVNGDTEINLSLDSKELAYLKIYLMSAAQWFPVKIWKRYKILCKLLQYFVISTFSLSLINDFGGFRLQTLFQQELNEPITVVKNLLWNLRFLFMAVFGIRYCRKRHLERFLSSLILTRKYWKETRRMIFIISFVALLGVLVFPVALEIMRMMLFSEHDKEPFKVKAIVVNCMFSVALRYFSLPIFFVVVHVVFLIYCQIRLFNAQIKQWPRSKKGKNRDKLIDIKMMIKDAEKVFQKFLIFHLCLLLLAFIPEVFSAAERLHNESQYKWKYYTSKPRKMDLQFIKYNGFNELKNTTTGVYFIPMQIVDVNSLPKVKVAQPDTEHDVIVTDYVSICKVVAAALGDLIEICILYSLPFILMGKIHKLLKDLPETIRSLKFEEQKQEDFVFQTEEDVETIVKHITTTKSIQVLGMQINAVVAVMVPLSMPLFVTVVHIMLRHVDIDP